MFNIQQVEGMEFSAHSETIDTMQKFGFPVIPYTRCPADAEQIRAAIEKIGAQRGTLPFDIDGVVIKLDSLTDRNLMGQTSNIPSGRSPTNSPRRKRSLPCKILRYRSGAPAC